MWLQPMTPRAVALAKAGLDGGTWAFVSVEKDAVEPRVCPIRVDAAATRRSFGSRAAAVNAAWLIGLDVTPNGLVEQRGDA